MRKISSVTVFLLITGSVLAQNTDMLDIRIGQMILIGLPKAEVDQTVLNEIKAGRVGSILIFEKNIPKSTSSFTALKKVIWTYQKAASIPLIVSIDQEGGKVNRLKEKYGFARSITAQEMGKGKTLDSVRFYSEATAATLAGLGINVNFAPVVDVAVNPNNTVIVKNGRSFSSNPDSVAFFAAEFMKPHRKFGVATVLKHFPGHGSSLEDTHLGMADVSKTWTPSELIPYQRLLATGNVDAVMSAHIVNKQLDPKGYPGTLSKRMIDSLLRKQFHFEGVVFSDDMQMQAITKEYGLEEAIKLAINAGIDILCFSNNIQGSEERTITKVHAIIRQLVISGQISQDRIGESFDRIIKLKTRLGANPEEYLQRELATMRSELDALKQQQPQKPVVKEVKPDTVTIVTDPEESNTKRKRKKH